MTDPAIEHGRRQAAALGPAAALRQQATHGQRETLIARGPSARHPADSGEQEQHEQRRRELELLQRGG